jgi:outer membrane biogenesis lipoprotein LolB
MRDAALLLLAVLSAACRPATDSTPAASQHAEAPAAVRQLGAWTGKGSTTLGFVSESGSFRIVWKTQNQDSAHPGSFQLTLRSGISGRPMKVIADHQGAGGASVEFGDDPRLYEFLVESSRIDWSISVQETFAPKGQD